MHPACNARSATSRLLIPINLARFKLPLASGLFTPDTLFNECRNGDRNTPLGRAEEAPPRKVCWIKAPLLFGFQR